jgi:hypothetical protein
MYHVKKLGNFNLVTQIMFQSLSHEPSARYATCDYSLYLFLNVSNEKELLSSSNLYAYEPPKAPIIRHNR